LIKEILHITVIAYAFTPTRNIVGLSIRGS